MNLYEYLKEKINIDQIENFSGDKYELAIVRYVMKEASKLFYRDNTFFLNKENLKDRKDIYEQEFNLEDIQNFNIVCKSYCHVIKDVLKKNYNIDSELISPFEDQFRHVDLLIKT